MCVKKIVYLAFFCMMFVGISNVKASTYYTNTKGVNFDKQQYDFISEIYYDGYQDIMTQADLDKMIDKGVIGSEVHKYTLDEDGIINDNLRSTSVYFGGRTLVIGVGCTSTICLTTLSAQWGGTPSIQSWDVIGFRTYNMTGVDPNLASIAGTGYSATYYTTSTQYKSFTNGFGYSVKLGNSSNLGITTSMYSNAGGTAYGSYQHATVDVSLNTSKSYTIGIGGYGSVFHFNGSAYGVYDAAPGVSKAVS